MGVRVSVCGSERVNKYESKSENKRKLRMKVSVRLGVATGDILILYYVIRWILRTSGE